MAKRIDKAAAKRAAAFAAMWEDARYLRLDAKKDAALKAFRRGEFYGSTQLPQLERAMTRAIRAVCRFEDVFLKQHGC